MVRHFFKVDCVFFNLKLYVLYILLYILCVYNVHVFLCSLNLIMDSCAVFKSSIILEIINIHTITKYNFARIIVINYRKFL